jgi:membrane protease YdiL (CAAX protease family)
VPRFSTSVTILSAVILLAGLAGFAWLQLSVPRLDRVPTPERALDLMVGRMMDLEEAVALAPVWERRLYDFTSGGRAYELAQAVEWFEEITAASPDPLFLLRLAVLKAEAGDLEWVRWQVNAWESRSDPFPSYGGILRAAYLEPTMAPDNEQVLQAELAEALPGGWFYDRLALNLAARGGDPALLTVTKAALFARGEPLLQRSRVLALVEVAVLAAGGVILIAHWRRGRRPGDARSLQVGRALLPPLWSGGAGIAVLFWGGALGIILIAILLTFGTDDPVVRLTVIPVTNLPLLMLARTYLLRGPGEGLCSAFGLVPVREGWRRLVLAVPAVLALGLLGEWAIDRVAVTFNHASHWTEWFDPDLVWGSFPVLGISLLEYVVLAPAFEELVFRGLLFATFRRRFGPGASALLSAALFAIAHGYGILGFVSVLWSGTLWAWTYEKTGSLLPGMIAHALNNLMVCTTVIVLLRM